MTVAVVTWNSADVLPGLVASLPAGAGDVPYRLVVVDNDSRTTPSRWPSALCPDATVRADRTQRGLRGRGQRRGRRHPRRAGGAGAQPRRTPRAGLPAHAAGGARPPAHRDRGPPARRRRRRADPLDAPAARPCCAPSPTRSSAPPSPAGGRRPGEVVTDPAPYADDATPDWAEGSTQLVSRACLDACGPWDESYFLYSEETEFHLRAGSTRLRRPLRRRRRRGPPRGRLRHLARGCGRSSPPTGCGSSRGCPPARGPPSTGSRSSCASRAGRARGDAIARAAVRVLVRPDAAARPSRARVARPRYPKSGTPPRSGPRRGRASVACVRGTTSGLFVAPQPVAGGRLRPRGRGGLDLMRTQLHHLLEEGAVRSATAPP